MSARPRHHHEKGQNPVPSHTSSIYSPAAIANLSRHFAQMGFGGPHDDPTTQDLAWGELVYVTVYAVASLNRSVSPEGVEEMAKRRLHAVLTNPGEDGDTDVEGGSVRRMRTGRENMSFINHGNAACHKSCCTSIYDDLRG